MSLKSLCCAFWKMQFKAETLHVFRWFFCSIKNRYEFVKLFEQHKFFILYLWDEENSNKFKASRSLGFVPSVGLKLNLFLKENTFEVEISDTQLIKGQSENIWVSYLVLPLFTKNEFYKKKRSTYQLSTALSCVLHSHRLRLCARWLC